MDLGIYLLSNYPNEETFLEAVRICDQANVDFLEIGIPFSDPIADGEVLEKASFEVLKKYNTQTFFDNLERIRSIYSKRIYIMTYTNIAYNKKKEIKKYLNSISGVILADLPVRESRRFEQILGCNIIKFATPESRKSDLNLAIKGSNDFLYFVSKRGTTGGNFALDENTIEKISYCRRFVKVYLGFGIKKPEDIKSASEYADGVIIGTQAALELEKGVQGFRKFIENLT